MGRDICSATARWQTAITTGSRRFT